MPTSINSSGITFPNGTTQTTAAAASSYVGGRGQVFTASGTFTVPTGVTAIKVTVVGGGGGSAGSSSFGGVGGTTTFTGYVSATGGGRGNFSAESDAAGTATSADLTIPGQKGYGSAGGSAGGGGWGQWGDSASTPSTGYGNGARRTSADGFGGGAGAGVGTRYITGLTSGAGITVTIGGGGGAGGGGGGEVGRPGVCIVEW